MKLYKSDKVIFLLAIIYSIPFLLNAELFKDDFYRAASGDPGYWDKDSRPLTTILMKAFNLGHVITDLSPLSFMVAMACMVFSAMIISRALSREVPNVISAVCASMIFLNPMFVGNATFSFDSASMGLSIAISIALAYYFSNYKYIDFVWKTIALTSVMSLYQPSSALFVSMTALVVIINFINKNRISLKEIITNAASFVAGFILYTKVVQGFFPPSEYAKRNSQFIDFHNGFINELTVAFSRNIEPIASSMPDVIKLLVIISTVITSLFILKISIFNKIAFTDRVLLVGSYVLFLLLFSGFSIAVKSDYVMPRVLMSLGLTLSLIFFISSQVKYLKHLTHIILILFTINAINIAYAFNNAIKHQNRFNSQLLTIISSVIHQNGILFVKNLTVVGWPPVSPPTKVIFNKYPYFKTIMPQYLSNAWGITALSPFYDLTIKNIQRADTNDFSDQNNKSDNIYTSCSIQIYKKENDILLDFTSKC
ncbi:TPA: glucosyltransferase domain-containing protein [Enterobacter cancerogenus]